MAGKRVKLNSENFKSQMLGFGYFYELLPPCFCSQSFAKHAKEAFKALGRKKPVTEPLLISTQKTDNSRRTIAIPNPWSFLSTVHIFDSNLARCQQFATSSHSHSPITFIHFYDNAPDGFEKAEMINSEAHRAHLGARSTFVANLKERLTVALGRPYKLTVDLATFYDSIYTHALSWSLCGKREAKRWHALIENRQEKQHPEDEPPDYKLADQLDAAIRRQKSNETNGIVTGPFTSRIFSEMLLCGVDKQLEKRANPTRGKVAFRRYVDDYSFYFRSREEAEQALTLIEQVLHEFGLRINHSKVSIERYPFDILRDLRRAFKRAFEVHGVFGVLNQASIFTEDGEKGAYKYALKWLKGRVPSKIEDSEISMLVNIGISYPNCSVLALNRIKEYGKTTGNQDLATAVNMTMATALESKHDQEALNGFYYCAELNLNIWASNIESAISKGNDLCKIIALDYIRHRKAKISQWDEREPGIMQAVDSLEQSLKSATTDGPHWLLLFESLNHDLMNVTLGNGVTSDLMQQLGELEVSFYQGLTAPSFLWAHQDARGMASKSEH